MVQGPRILPWGGVVSQMPFSTIRLLPWFSRRVQFRVWRAKGLLQMVSGNGIQHGRVFYLFGQRRGQTLAVRAPKRSKLDWVNSFPKASYTPEGINTYCGSRWLKRERFLLPATDIDPAAAACFQDTMFPLRNQCGGSHSISHLADYL